MNAPFYPGSRISSRAIATLVGRGPDAIQLTVGQAPLLQAMPGRQKPSLVLRTDVANVYGRELPRALFSRMIESRWSRRCGWMPPAWS